MHFDVFQRFLTAFAYTVSDPKHILEVLAPSETLTNYKRRKIHKPTNWFVQGLSGCLMGLHRHLVLFTWSICLSLFVVMATLSAIGGLTFFIVVPFRWEIGLLEVAASAFVPFERGDSLCGSKWAG